MSDFLPKTAAITKLKTLTDKEKLFTITLDNGDSLDHKPGQFVMVSLSGVGEAPISISSSPLRGNNSFDLCVRFVGNLTNKMHKLSVNDRIGIRGPYGNGFPLDRIYGKDIIFIAGGLGIAPLRSLIQHVLKKREEYGRVTILYGAKRPQDILFSEEVYTWVEDDSIEMHITVDVADSSWNRHVGVLPHLFKFTSIDPLNSVAVIVGPPVMYRFVIMEALTNGIFESNIFMSLERRMRCGLGKCGHCQINGVYVCQDGPVFSYKNAKKLKEAL
ncbi:MAG: FAD/NAD(P)-binding protein [Thermodesulfobacteriota bacterium]